MLDAALDYARRGLRVFPLRGKKPWIAVADGGHGVYDATDDADLIRRWWRAWPSANIGVQLTGMAIIDVDAGRCGHDTFDALLEIHNFDPGPCVLTGGGGMHWYFQAHPGVKTGTDRLKVKPDDTGVDVKSGPGSYAVVPGSIHPNGTAYLWLPNYGPERPLPEFPSSLIAELNPPKAVTAPRPAATRSSAPGHGPRALAGLARTVENAAEGERHAILFWASCCAGELIRDRLVDGGAAYDALEAAAFVAYGPDADPNHVGRTIVDGVKKVVSA